MRTVSGEETIEIRSTDGEVLLIDPEDVPLVALHRIHRHNGYFAIKVGYQRKAYLHRVILGRPQEGLVPYVINGNPADCRKQNLAWVHPSVRSHRSDRPKRGGKVESQYRGVKREGDRWKACIVVDRQTQILGSFPTEELAARKYDQAAEKRFGAFARINFPEPERPLPPGIGNALDRLSVVSANNRVIQVDPEFLPTLARLDWQLLDGVFQTLVGTVWVPLHALVTDVTGKDNARLLHLNGDRWDYRVANLGWEDQPNLHRQGLAAKEGSFVGVRRVPNGRYSASIKVLKKATFLGTFDSEIDAAKAYDRAALKAYGPKAKLNFPKPLDVAP